MDYHECLKVEGTSESTKKKQKRSNSEILINQLFIPYI